MGESDLVVALRESNDLLRNLIDRQRRTVAMLRRINSRLRAQLAVAHANDEEFKAMCQEIYEYDAVESGLLSPESSQTSGHEQERDVSSDKNL